MASEQIDHPERTAEVLALLYEQNATGKSLEEIQRKRSANANVIRVGGRRSPHPDPDRQAIAFHRAGEYATGERNDLSPENAMMAVEYGLFATPEDEPDAEPVSFLALRFPAPVEIVVARAGIGELSGRWLAYGPLDAETEDPDRPVRLPGGTVKRYCYEVGPPEIVPLDETDVSYEAFQNPERNEGPNPFEVSADGE